MDRDPHGLEATFPRRLRQTAGKAMVWGTVAVMATLGPVWSVAWQHDRPLPQLIHEDLVSRARADHDQKVLALGALHLAGKPTATAQRRLRKAEATLQMARHGLASSRMRATVEEVDAWYIRSFALTEAFVLLGLPLGWLLLRRSDYPIVVTQYGIRVDGVSVPASAITGAVRDGDVIVIFRLDSKPLRTIPLSGPSPEIDELVAAIRAIALRPHEIDPEIDARDLIEADDLRRELARRSVISAR